MRPITELRTSFAALVMVRSGSLTTSPQRTLSLLICLSAAEKLAPKLDSNSHLPPSFYTGLVGDASAGEHLAQSEKLSFIEQTESTATNGSALAASQVARGTLNCGCQRRTAKWSNLWFRG